MDWVTFARAATGVAFAWALGVNSVAAIRGFAFRKWVAWLLPFAVAWVSFAGVLIRVFYLSSSSPFTPVEILGFVSAPLCVVAGSQAIHKIHALQEEQEGGLK